ncbi:MAG: prepilin-type N-terminal cleavage/methylation domain-containing protein [Burkholderiaceae bacterium]
MRRSTGSTLLRRSTGFKLMRRSAGFTPMRRSAGFTLVEAVVALALFATGILGVIASVTHHARAGQDARYRTEAAAAADELVSLIQTTDPAGRAARFSPGGAGFDQWLADRLRAPGSGLPGADATVAFGALAGDDRTVSIEIRWTPPREARRDLSGTASAESVTHRYRTVVAIIR